TCAVQKLMSAKGQKRTYAVQNVMSALPPKATAKADPRKGSCLLYPRKRTCAVQDGMSAKGQKRTSGRPQTDAATRGRMTLISVNSPGFVSTSIVPLCCLTIMSWLIESPRPVPSPVGLVVKNGSKIFSFTSGVRPVPLSRILISTQSPRLLVEAVRVGSKSSP